MSTQRYYPTPCHHTYFPYSSSSHETTTRYRKYDVFLSFRGEDTRKGFTDHLYAALNRKGIFTFRDNEELERGQPISPKLLKAIEESSFVVAVLSTNYADSTWCLEELAKAVECMKMGLKILPVFRYVDPSEVRKQTGTFGKAFLKHEETFKDKKEEVQRWRDALTAVANLAGWHLKDGPESEVVEDIVGNSFTILNQAILSESKDLVAMDSRIKEMLSYLEIGLLDVRIIGIRGMKGIGKTTLAKVVAKRIRDQFEGYSYLANVREATEKQGLKHLQEQLLSDLLTNVSIQNIDMEDVLRHRLRNKKALIIVDDVDEVEQVEALCDRTWFGPGSRIIITSTNDHVLRRYADKTYEVKLLTNDEALQLFSWKSFQKDQVGEGFLELSKDFLKHAVGLPLAVTVLGSFLSTRSLDAWSSQLARLKENPEKKIIDVLKVSFDGLSETEQIVFLDIACFFKGEDKDRVIRILETGCGYPPRIDIDVLVDKSLVTLFGRKLWMHDLIQELGWEIVRRECRASPGGRSRLWLPKDIIHVLANNKGTTTVQSIFLQLPEEKEVLAPKKQRKMVCLNADAFSKMDNLRLLKIQNSNFHGNFEYLSNNLQFLEWHEYPLKSLPSDFESDKLVELNLCLSRIENLWEGEKCWNMLQFIDLSDSEYLIMTPNFNEVPNLKTLVLQGCTRLVDVHPSIGVLRKLSLLNMRCCQSVESLPPLISLDSLEKFTLSDCSSLKKFPEIEGNMENLLELHLDGTAIEELPPSIKLFTGLTFLNLGECKNLLRLPSSIKYLRSLNSLILAGCSKLDDIPENLNCLKLLEKLDLSGTAIRESSSIAGLSSLRALYLSNCNLMEGALLDGLASLDSLEILHLRGNNFVHLPESISQLFKLQYLDVSNCRRLQLMPTRLASSVQHVDAQDCTSLQDYIGQFVLWGTGVSGITTFNCLVIPNSRMVKS